MREICLSGSMSGERKRSVAEWPKLPRLSPTLPLADMAALFGHVRFTPNNGHSRLSAGNVAGPPGYPVEARRGQMLVSPASLGHDRADRR